MVRTICPNLRKKLDELIEWSKNRIVISDGGGECKVSCHSYFSGRRTA
jgi:hypothetical protein